MAKSKKLPALGDYAPSVTVKARALDNICRREIEQKLAVLSGTHSLRTFLETL